MALADVPEVAFANVGGSGSWGYRFGEGVFDGTSPLQVRRLETGLVFETPYGDSPPFGLYELEDRSSGSRRQFLRVWMHGVNPGLTTATAADPEADSSFRATEKVFSVLRRAKTRWVLVDASVGGINYNLDAWDLVIAHDFIDDMKRVARVEGRAMLRLRYPYCSYMRGLLFEAAGAELPRLTALAQEVEGRPVYPKIVRRGIYVCPDGPWFESTAQVEDYRRRGFDIVGKTLVPEVQLARTIGAHFASLNPVVNPAEGLMDPDTGQMHHWDVEDLRRIYRHYGPTISAIMLRAMAAIDPDQRGCACEAYPPGSNMAEFGKFIEGESAS